MPSFCKPEAEKLFPTVHVTQKKSIFYVGRGKEDEGDQDEPMLMNEAAEDDMDAMD